MPPTQAMIAELEDLAEREPEALLSVGELVRQRFMRIEDIGSLRSAGLAFYQTGPDDDAPDVAVEAGAFLTAARVVAEQRAADAVLEHAPAPARLN